MNLKSILDIVLNMLLPIIWTAGGPALTTIITAGVNSVMNTYVPRPVQLVLASMLGAAIAGITGSAEGLDPGVAAGIGAAASLGMETGMMLSPKTFLTSAPGTPK